MFCPTLNFPSRSPARRDAQGMSATVGSANSQSASECRERAQARKSGTSKAGVIWWSTDAEKRKRREKSRRLVWLLSGTRLWSGSGKSVDFPRYPVPGAIGRRMGGQGGNTPQTTPPTFAAKENLVPGVVGREDDISQSRKRIFYLYLHFSGVYLCPFAA